MIPNVWAFLTASLLVFSLSWADKGYILTSPGVLVSEATVRLLLILKDIEGDGEVLVSLARKQYPDPYNNFTTEVVSDKNELIHNGKSAVIFLNVPKLPSTNEFSYRYWLQINGSFPSDDYTFSNESEIQVQNVAFETFIQTDKPLYKPGQKIQFRVLPVDRELRPLQNAVGDIWLEDSSGTKMALWPKQKFSKGIEQFSFQLIDEPPLGFWKIYANINGSITQALFEVKEYVLPKFEIVITPPPYVLESDKQITWKICPMYTYGKPVEGTLTLNVSYESYYYRPSNFKVPSLVVTEQIHDCITYTLDIDDLNAQKPNQSYSYYYNERTIKLAAEFEERGTGITVTGENTVSRYLQVAISLSLIKTGENLDYFKPGFPIRAKLQVNFPDGTPAPNKKVEICYSTISERSEACWEARGSYQACKHYTSGDDGIISFGIAPLRQDVTSLTITATYSEMHDGKVSTEKMTHTLKNWYSPSGSFIQIEPINQELECGIPQDIEVLFSSPDDEEITIYYQVHSRGRIVVQDMIKASVSSEIPYTHDCSYIYNSDCENETDKGELNAFFEKLDKTFVVPEPVRRGGKAQLKLLPDFTLAPLSKLLVFFIRKDGEVVADSTTIPISKCLRNKVTFEFSHDQGYPGTPVEYHISTQPNSLCGITAADKSLYLMSTQNKLDVDRVYDYLKQQNYRSYLSQKRPRPCSDTSPCHEMFYHNAGLNREKRSIIRPLPSQKRYGYVDSISAFDSAGIFVLSDLTLETRPCDINYYPIFYDDNFAEVRPLKSDMPGLAGVPYPTSGAGGGFANRKQSSEGSLVAGAKSVVDIRHYFPENWLWDLIFVEEEKYTKETVLPHTLTTWVGNAICLNPDAGLGISQDDNITAFQPFFVTLNLPYSVKRGEKIPLVITAAFYLEKCLPVKIALDKTDEFTLEGSPTVTTCICKDRTFTHTYQIVASVLGELNMTIYATNAPDSSVCGDNEVSTLIARDAESKPLLVKPEGFPQEKIVSTLVCPNEEENGTFIASYQFDFPQDLVEDSERAYVSTSGDLLGPAIENLNNLVRVPTGCGEQNLAKFIPNILVLDYLKNTGQNKEDVEQRALNNLKIGAQRQLSFKRSDGSYGVFGERDDVGSTWLTAFVIKAFTLAGRYIFIDQSDVRRSQDWLISLQRIDGCFPSQGFAPNPYMRGENEKTEAPITAFILTSLLEGGYDNTTVIEAAVECIKLDENPEVYNLALYTYVLTLAEDPLSETYLARLEEKAFNENGLKFWRANAEKVGGYSLSSSIEIAGYAILTHLKLNGRDALSTTLPIVKWILRQMNTNGGFVSSQDTVIGLQALSSYSSLIGEDDIAKKLTFEFATEASAKNFYIDSSNKLVQQIEKLSTATEKIVLSASGEGCALAQIEVRYNVKNPPVTYAFEVNGQGQRQPEKCQRANISFCYSYFLEGLSNMVVAEIDIVSGFEPFQESLSQLVDKKDVKKYEIEKDKVILYFDGMPKSQKCLDFIVQETLPVEDAMPGTIKVFDYYTQERQDSTQYSIPPRETCT